MIVLHILPEHFKTLKSILSQNEWGNCFVHYRFKTKNNWKNHFEKKAFRKNKKTQVVLTKCHTINNEHSKIKYNKTKMHVNKCCRNKTKSTLENKFKKMF